MFVTDAGCTEDISPFLLNLTKTNCRIGSSCLDFLCCSQITTIGRTLNYDFSVDPCLHTLSVNIEDFGYQRSLVNFEYGVAQTFTIGQVFVVE